MSWKFYACVAVAILTIAAVAWIKLAERRRIRKEAEEKVGEERRKKYAPPPERPPQSQGPPHPDRFSKNPWPLTEEELERRIRGGSR